MKPIFKEFSCPQCGQLRYIDVNGICFDCRNEKRLISLAIKRKKQHKFNSSYQPLSIEV